jgi:lysozyme
MIVFPAAVAFVLARPVIKHEEDFCASPYLCAASRPTVGWGSTKYEDGKPVKLTDPAITPARGDVLLTYGMMRVDKQLRPLFTRQPTAHQYAAILSLGYNVGVGCHDGIKNDLADSTLLEMFNAGDTQGAADQFPLWNKAHVNGKVVALDGLTKRRALERTLFLTPDK